MNSAQLDTAKNILSGLNYLLIEAEKGGITQIGNIIQICIRDICISLENRSGSPTNLTNLYDSDLFMAIKFLSRYASIKDEDLKRELLEELEKINRAQIPGASNAG